MELSLKDKLISFQHIVENPLPSVDWLVKPLIGQPGRVIVFGEPGSMKSWGLIDLGLHLAAGKDWLDTFSIPTPKKVVYLDEEMPEQELWRRVQRLASGNGLEAQALPFKAVSQLGFKVTADVVTTLLNELIWAEFDPDVLIVETLRRVLKGSENEAEDIGAFWESLIPLVKKNKTVIVSHHMRKPGLHGAGESKYRASGSGDIIGGADAAFAITRRERTITVECAKQRVAPEAPAFDAKLLSGSEEDSPVTLKYLGLASKAKIEKGVKDDELVQARLLIREVLGDSSLPVKTATILDYVEAHGPSRRTGERALQLGKAEGWLEAHRRAFGT